VGREGHHRLSDPNNPEAERKEVTMASGKPKDTQDSNEVAKPDYDLAIKLYREDIKKSASDAATSAQELSEAYKAIRKRAHIQPQAAKLAFKLDAMESAKRDDFLRSLNGLLKGLNIFMPRDLVDAANGDGAIGDGVIPAGERPKPKLVTIPYVGDDSDLNPEQEVAADPAPEAEAPQPEAEAGADDQIAAE
jgi:hypothetical protein